MEEVNAKPTDIVARYLYDSKQFNSNDAKASAFLDKRNPSELSVCVTTDLSEPEIWKIASILRSDKPVKARASLKVSKIYGIALEQGAALKVIIDGVPHPSHANIKFPPLQDSLRNTIAAELADKSELVHATS